MSRLQSKLKENKGFTLLETIIAFAILAIVVTMVTVIISTSANSYGAITTDINLQYESQIAMSQMQEYLIDCNAYLAVNADGTALYVFNKKDATQYSAYKFEKSSTTNELVFYQKTILIDALNTADSANFAFEQESGQLMSGYVKAFSSAIAVDAGSIELTITYGWGNKTYVGEQVVAFRNQVEDISSNVP